MIDVEPLKIAIASGKGGTGKTLVATNLASLMSRSQDVLLVDLDVEEPNDFVFITGEETNLAKQYKMIPEWMESQCTLCGICGSVCNYHAIIQIGTFIAVFKELCHSCYACAELCPAQALSMLPHKIGETKTIQTGNLTFIESRLEVGEEQAVPLIQRTHDLINKNGLQNIPVQIFDCPPGTSCPVVAAVRPADFVILVTEPTPFGLNDLKLAIDTMKNLNKPMAVIINRSDIGNHDVEDVCQQMQIPIITRIPHDEQIARLNSNGQLVYDQVSSVRDPFQQIVSFIRDIS